MIPLFRRQPAPETPCLEAADTRPRNNCEGCQYDSDDNHCLRRGYVMVSRDTLGYQWYCHNREWSLPVWQAERVAAEAWR